MELTRSAVGMNAGHFRKKGNNNELRLSIYCVPRD